MASSQTHNKCESIFVKREKTSATAVTARTEPRQKRSFFSWSERRDSNPQPSAWEADAIPLGHSRIEEQDNFNLNHYSCQIN